MTPRRVSLLLAGLVLLGLPACRCGQEPGAAPPAEPPYPRETLVEAYGQGPGRVELLHLQPAPRQDAFVVRQGHQVILEAPGRVIGLVAPVPSKEQPRFLLAELNHSGNKCPLWYRVIDLREGVARVSGEDFGTCWRIKGEPAELNGALRIELFADRGGGSTTSFWYKDGEVIKVPTVKARNTPAR
jgi:hypothetical protein